MEARIIERDRERAHLVRGRGRSERAGDARVEPSAEVPTDRDVRAQPEVHARAHQIIKLRDRIGRLLPSLGILEIVVPTHAQHAVFPYGPRSRLERADAAEWRPRWARGPQRENL